MASVIARSEATWLSRWHSTSEIASLSLAMMKTGLFQQTHNQKTVDLPGNSLLTLSEGTPSPTDPTNYARAAQTDREGDLPLIGKSRSHQPYGLPHRLVNTVLDAESPKPSKLRSKTPQCQCNSGLGFRATGSLIRGILPTISRGTVEKVPFSSLRATARQSRTLSANEIATSLRSSL